MAGLAAIGGVLSSVVGVIGSFASAGAMNSAAARDAANQKALADAQALREEAAAKREAATAQLTAGEEERKKDLLQSQFQNVAAGGGFMATDPTALGLTGEIEKRGTFLQQVAMYGGQEKKAALEDQARLTRFGGDLRASSILSNARARSTATIIGGLGSGLSGLLKYGGGGGGPATSYRWG